MNYINYKILTSKGLSLHEHGVLTLIKQNKTDDLSQQIEFEVKGTPIIEKLLNISYIEEIKGVKGQTFYQKLRTTKKGNEALDLISTPIVTEKHIRMRDYLIKMYLNHEDTERVVGNTKLIAIYISIMQNYLNIDIYQFYYLCEFFLSEQVFTKKLENIFMDRNKIRYGDFKNNIEDSPLYQFYEQRVKEVQEYWSQKN